MDTPSTKPKVSNLDIYGTPQMLKSLFTQFIGIVLLSISVGIIINIVNGNSFSTIALIICIVPILLALYFARRQHFELTTIILAVVLLSLITIVVTNGQGIRQINVIAYPATLIIASMVVRKRITALLTLYSIACVAWLIFGEYFGIFTPAASSRSMPGDFIIAAIVLIVTVFMVRLLTEKLFFNTVQLQKELRERITTEKALNESLVHRSAILDNIPGMAWLKDKHNRYIAVNETYRQSCGMANEDLLGKTDLDIWPEELAQAYRKDDNEVMRSGERMTFEERLVENTGQEIWIHTVKTPIFDDSGQVIGTAGIARDITEHMKMEESIRSSEIHYRAIVESTGDLICRFLPDTTLTFVNTAYGQYFGKSPRELVGIRFLELIPEDGWDAVQAQVNSIVAAKETVTYEHEVVLPDGEIRWQQWTDTPILDDNGQVIELQSVGRDITESYQAREALRSSEERYRLLFESNPQPMWVYDLTTLKFLAVNNTAVYEYGYSWDEFLQMTLKDIRPEEDIPLLLENLAQSTDEFEHSGYWRHRKKDGTIIDVEIISHAFNYDGRRAKLVLANNVTERKKAEEEIKYAEKRYRTLFEEAPVMYGITKNIDGIPYIVDCNNMFLSTLGYSRAEVIQQPLANFYTSDSKSSLLDEGGYQRALAGSFITEERELLTRYGRVIKTLLRAIPEVDAKGNVSGTRAMYVDITERKRMEELLFEEKERAEVTLHSIGDAVITTDTNALVKYINPVAELLTGWTLADAVDKPLAEVFHIIQEGTRQEAVNPAERCISEGRIVGLANHTILISREGIEYAIDDSAAPICNINGDIIGVVLVFHDVSEERRLSKQMAHDAMHDTLTGLINRREFEKRLERALNSAKERKMSHILCYLDLDQFKIINDTAGHIAGDQLLKQVSSLLSGFFRKRDTLARLGGDEFGLLLENCELEHALTICNDVIVKLRDFPFVWEERNFQVGVSIGIVQINAQKENVTELLSQADIACYSAKDLGRGRIFVYQADDTETVLRHGEILQAARMRDAMVNEDFRLFCQPIACLNGDSFKITHYEILLRMEDGNNHMVLPGEFIPSAERYGLMPAIDRWVIRQTFLTMARHNLRGTQITINLSGNSLIDETLLDYVFNQLGEFSIPPEQICFEITETAAIQHLSKAQVFINGFRKKGGKIALDDFGSGFSSFRYLKALPVDYIKIDGSFVNDMLSNPSDQVMVEAITQVGHALSIKVIAEHASNLEIIDRLREIGVECAQGYGIGVPLSIESVWEEFKKK